VGKTDRDRARRFRNALAKGYAEYSLRSAQPTRLECLARRFDRIGFWSGVVWLLALLPLVSRPWWNDEFLANFGTGIAVVVMAPLLVCLVSFSAAFILGIRQQHRDYHSSEESWRRR
jgi:hypothetical protein